MKTKLPKIRVLRRPTIRGNSVHIVVQFNYEGNVSNQYGFNIPASELLDQTLEQKLKELYEEKQPRQIDTTVPTEIDW